MGEAGSAVTTAVPTHVLHDTAVALELSLQKYAA
jgi:hypothetical protein